MDALISILDSFVPERKEKRFINALAAILAEKVIPTYPYLEARIEDNRAVFSKGWEEIISALNRAHAFEHFVPPQYGGQGISDVDLYCMMEILGFASPGIGIIFVSHGRAIDIVLGGNEEQKQAYLPKMARGYLGAIAMTEERAGSDASAIGLQAKPFDDHYVFDGEKIFISNSGLADFYAVLANTRGTAGPRSLSVFIVERDRPGFFIKGLPEKDGLRVLPTGRLIFRDCSVPSRNLIGEEGVGLFTALEAIDRGRIHIAGICCGLAYRIFREISRHVHSRRQFNHPLTSSQDISFQIAELHTRMNAARGLCFHALRQLGTADFRIGSSQAKLYASEMVMEVAARAQVLMGGRGYLKTDLVNQLSADARGMEYLEGTSNVQKMIIAKELFRMYHKEGGDSRRSA